MNDVTATRPSLRSCLLHRRRFGQGFRAGARAALVAVPLALGAAGSAAAQQPLDRPLRVFLDCTDLSCDQDFYVEAIPWVDFVRDRQDADVHVLVTSQATGGGGVSYSLELIGRQQFAEQRLRLVESTAADATSSDRREALAAVIRLGLAPLARSTSTSPAVEIAGPAPAAEGEPASRAEDPWDAWVFLVGANAFLNGESQQKFFTGSGSASATRVTPQWKLGLSLRGSLSRSEFELSDTSTFVSERETYTASGLTVRSVGPHWAAGVVGSWTRSTFTNYDSSIRFGPAVEYNVFPYSESTRRLLTALYAVGPRFNDYAETTLFGTDRETLLEQLLVLSYDVTQPWGDVNVALEASHFITRLDASSTWEEPQFNLELGGRFNVRLIRGLSANLFGSIEMVRGQLHLSAAELTEEEIVAQQRELATDYRYFVSVGLSYRFGSIFSSVVNPRFDALD